MNDFNHTYQANSIKIKYAATGYNEYKAGKFSGVTQLPAGTNPHTTSVPAHRTIFTAGNPPQPDPPGPLTMPWHTLAHAAVPVKALAGVVSSGFLPLVVVPVAAAAKTVVASAGNITRELFSAAWAQASTQRAE